ncbi:Uncharacterized protein TPAR_04731 [Tolypocladium paradoxum]|uniref:Uncharacterized protein n=1 Tax=Tolypocladium paradoxum TaxID=94208 RepID=A0A2S4KY02_9HYPO|nr:Uncharacterized protein TPAR_04731 [Tolypocladium paradoxum]
MVAGSGRSCWPIGGGRTALAGNSVADVGADFDEQWRRKLRRDRTWSNPEFLQGIRLDEVNEDLQDAAKHVSKACLSPEGYDTAIAPMRINRLGDLVHTPAIMNDFSCIFVIFGRGPSTKESWAFRVAATISVQRLLLQGADGSVAVVCRRRAEPHRRRAAQRYSRPAGRGRDGAASDAEITKRCAGKGAGMQADGGSGDAAWLLEPRRPETSGTAASCRTKAGPLVSEIKSWFHETHFCWIGGFEDSDPFHYRIQSPVVIVEFDHHSGVSITNKEPARFHIHTLLQTPKVGDYVALRPRSRQGANLSNGTEHSRLE